MLDAAEAAVSFAANRTREHLDTDRMTVLAIIKCIEIIGEAASAISKEFQRVHPTIPWQDVIGMRRRPIHAYYDVNIEIAWQTIVDDIPPLITDLKKLLSLESGDGGHRAITSTLMKPCVSDLAPPPRARRIRSNVQAGRL